MLPRNAPYALAPLCLVAACDWLRPAPPRITPRSASITSATSQGLGLRVELTAHNPNRVDVTVRSIEVRVTLAGRDLGTTRVPDSTSLPSRRDVTLTVNVVAPWQDLPGIVVATALNENVPYRLDGTARVGGERVNLDVPFHVESTMPRSVLTGALGIPGLGR